MWHAPLYAHKSKRFLTFNGWESNWHFDFWLCFSHNLCCKYSNGSCKPILDIYVLKSFQWYKKLLNSMNFDPSNHSLDIQESIRTPTLKVEAHLGMCGFIPSCSPTLPKVWMWLPSCTLNPHLSMPLTLVVSPRLGSWHLHSREGEYYYLS